MGIGCSRGYDSGAYLPDATARGATLPNTVSALIIDKAAFSNFILITGFFHHACCLRIINRASR